ncbi:hypothetical protein OG728_37700 [Streptomyces microflavus]|uniref:hypothetical protein n=1 Tax=Streptomyces microflavus TaxID=1919 RepID=UPI002E0D6606|nr:hypothetical protein OG728_37700 [Streptomyces microflavus]
MTWETTALPALAIVTSSAVAIFSMRSQRRIAEDGRIWEKRAALYVELLEHQRPYLASADMTPEVHLYFGPQLPEERALLRSLTARSDAFASRDVRDQWRVTMLTIHNLDVCISAMSDPMNPTPEESGRATPLSQAREAALDKLRNQIRSELRTERPRKWWQLRSRRAEPSALS